MPWMETVVLGLADWMLSIEQIYGEDPITGYGLKQNPERGCLVGL